MFSGWHLRSWSSWETWLEANKIGRSKVVNFTQGALPAWWFSHIGISRTDRYLSQKLRKPQQNLSKIIWHILCLELKLKISDDEANAQSHHVPRWRLCDSSPSSTYRAVSKIIVKVYNVQRYDSSSRRPH